MSPAVRKRPSSGLWWNWRAFAEGRPSLGGAEFALYTDAHFTSEVRSGLGPYQILNTVPTYEDEREETETSHVRRRPRPLVLRVADHLVDPPEGLSLTWLDNSSLDSEMASLLSLSLGRRVTGGGLTRRFRPDKDADPLGDPYEYGHRVPRLPQPAALFLPMLPDLRQPVRLNTATEVLETFAVLSDNDASLVLPAAGAYRDAIWNCDDQPEESWLRLISAVEAAAGRKDLTPAEEVEALELTHPNVVGLLRPLSGGVLEAVAHELSGLTGSTKRFVTFLSRFKPAAPMRVVEPHIDWADLRRPLRQVYGLRSAALHNSHPMPGLMTKAPASMSDDMWRIFFTSQHRIGGYESQPGDVPMRFDTFAHLVRGALLNWWRSLATDTAQPGV